MTDAFWIDHTYDTDNADPGTDSRYGNYIRHRDFAPWTVRDQHVELAVFAWAVATMPVMSPGYVRSHPRIRAHNLARSGWDGSLVASVVLVCPAPAALAGLRDWRGWPHEPDWSGDSDVTYAAPSEEDLTGGNYLLVSADLEFTIPSVRLPAAPSGELLKRPGVLESAARTVIAVLVPELNAIVSPVIEAIEGH